MLKLNLQYFGHWCEEPTHWKRPWSWGQLRALEEVSDREWHVWMASPTQWTRIWANSGRWWRTGKPDVLQSWGRKQLDMTEWLNNKQILLGLLNLWYYTFVNQLTGGKWDIGTGIPYYIFFQKLCVEYLLGLSLLLRGRIIVNEDLPVLP